MIWTDYCATLVIRCPAGRYTNITSHRRITALRYASFVIRRLSKAVKLQNNPYYARPFLLHKGAYVNKFTGPFVQQKPLFRVA